MYVGILDFYNKLSPVEQSVYPPDYKQQINECLRQEETIFGALSESDKKEAIDKSRNLNVPMMLKRDEPIWKQLVELTSKLSPPA